MVEIEGIVAVFLAALVFVYLFNYFYCAVLKKEEISLDNKIVLFALAYLLIVIVTNFCGVKRPGHILERGDYEAMLYVRLYPNDEGVKSYKVPALIYTYSYECGPDGETCKRYSIKYAIMPNGGKIVFETPETVPLEEEITPLQLGENVTREDIQNRKWGVELTSEPAET